MKPSARKKRKLVFWLLLGAVLLLCCCCAAGAAALGKPGSGPGWSGLNGQVCAGFATTPRLQVGVAWYLPISSYYPPLMASPSVVCVDVPWPLMAVWPSMAGQLVLPP